ncbi:MAG: helix-turn-helix transcriptional regulator [Clostridia bacterium]|nr:helix-turn-helix transcriptional regulator [Clostridia bacterium]
MGQVNFVDYKALGDRIRYRRRSLGYTQEQLSKKSGISLSYVGLIERGDRSASIGTLVALANALEISTDILLQDSLNESVFSVNDDYIAKNYILKEMRKLLYLEDEK